MKQKIKSALEQEYQQRLGVSEEAFERVAALGETFIKEESQIADFVKGAEGTLKLYQSEADKIRTELNGKIKALEGEKTELEAKLKGAESRSELTTEPQSKSEPKDGDDLIKQMEALFDAKMKPLQDKIEQFESGQATKQAIADAEAQFKSNDWVKKYKDEADDAWERAIEVNELGGNKMNAQQLNEKAMGYFGKAVKRKGEDISQPFKSAGSGQENHDFKGMVDRLKASGKIASETNE